MAEPAASLPELGAHSRAPHNWGELLLVSVKVSVEVAIQRLTVRELFRLDVGSVLVSAQQAGANAPVVIGDVALAWGEFQVVEDHLALRVVELA